MYLHRQTEPPDNEWTSKSSGEKEISKLVGKSNYKKMTTDSAGHKAKDNLRDGVENKY